MYRFFSSAGYGMALVFGCGLAVADSFHRGWYVVSVSYALIAAGIVVGRVGRGQPASERQA